MFSEKSVPWIGSGKIRTDGEGHRKKGQGRHSEEITVAEALIRFKPGRYGPEKKYRRLV
jgi:hypothetical protein